MQAGRRHLERAVELYDRRHSLEHLATYGADPLTQGLVNLAWLDWCTGYADRALQRADEAVRLSRELAHPLSTVYALCVSVPVHQGRGEPETAFALAEEGARIASRHGFAYWEAWAGILRGWAMVRLRMADAGLAALRQGIDMYRATGAQLFLPYSLALLAEVYRDAGSADEALRALEQATDDARRIEVHFYDAEICGLRGELLQMSPASAPGEAEPCFSRAIAIAREQGALALELRAVSRLARHLQRQGRREEAQRGLAEVYDRFTEGWSNRDLREAAAMLERAGDAPARGASRP
jgi:adenylate cyclase